jgi:hypothetical protein
MAAVSTRVLTHLDPRERYAVFENQFDERVYIRFTIPEQCLTHVQIHAGSSQRQVYFFLPDFETQQLSRPIHGFNGTRIYLYCINEESVLLNRNIFSQRALYNIFNADRIEFQLNAAQLELLYELKLNAPRGSAEYDQWAALGTRRLDRIRAMFQEHVDTQLGDEPAELIRDDMDLPVI